MRTFGTEIHVANLVTVAMTREMAAIMTAIVLAGRTGAAFAAQLGTMPSNEEIDALTTLGISPVDFLVLPRMLAPMLMMPLPQLYSVFAGALGGFLVGVGMLDLTSTTDLEQTRASFSFRFLRRLGHPVPSAAGRSACNSSPCRNISTGRKWYSTPVPTNCRQTATIVGPSVCRPTSPA
ncbi:ABC-type transport system involved in resistance to organic solvents, permease component [Azospirillum doebereinerae]